MNNDQLYFYNRGFNDCLAKCLDAPPAKTLTDEEIAEVFDNTFKVRDFDDAFLKFAKAILRKAQEK
jgi:hypothetical protein